MESKVLYRRYRPQTFDEIFGQDEVVSMLRNQVVNSSIGHAYIFSGIRGTGKTSSAKIFSRAINCINPQNGNPCNECQICKGIIDETNLDVLELDAASNNGVDNIREIRENVKFLPSQSKYKVYIIDEAHMLSNSAFNALLKTLEEPPSHVVFILATTEFPKLPITIQSRCMRVDFGRIPLKKIEENLERISIKSGYTVDKKVLEMISNKSEGSARDSLSILNKLLDSTQVKEINMEIAIKSIGIMDKESITKLMEFVTKKDVFNILSTTNDLLLSGLRVEDIFENIAYFLRELMIIIVLGVETTLIAGTSEYKNDLNKRFNGIKISFFENGNDLLNKYYSNLKNSIYPRMDLEMFLLSLAKIEMISKSTENINTFKKEEENIQESINKENEVKLNLNFNLVDNWNLFLQNMKKQSLRLFSMLVEGVLIQMNDKEFIVQFKENFDFHMETLSSYDNKLVVEKVLKETFGKNYSFILTKEGQDRKIEKSNDSVEEIKDFFSGFEDKLVIK
jgi:DNA polymerase-3 subunit gamma/tau